jgi:hypothetical protein
MQLALRGLGAMSLNNVPYTDTGDGITPDNFQSLCCLDGLTTPSCSAFVQANQSRFGGYTPCSSAAHEALTFPAPVAPTAPPPPAGGYTPALLTGDPNAIIDQIVAAGASRDQAAQMVAARGALAALCAVQDSACQDAWYGGLVKPTADCTGCQLDLSKPAFWLLGIAAAIFVLFLVKK